MKIKIIQVLKYKDLLGNHTFKFNTREEAENMKKITGGIITREIKEV